MRWQPAHTGLLRCAVRRSRMVLRVGSGFSTLEKSTFGGGRGTIWHRNSSRSALPRRVGELRPGCAFAARKLASVSRPDPIAVAWELVLAPPRRRWHVIDRPQRGRDERISAGEQVAVVFLLHQQVIHDRAQCLLTRILRRGAVELGIDLGVFGQRREFVKIEHVIEEGTYPRLEARAREHAAHGPFAACRGIQLAALGLLQQLIVGRGVPQEQTQARCERILSQPHFARVLRIGFRLIDDEQKIRRNEHPLERGRQPEVEVTQMVRSVVRLGDNPRQFEGCERPTIEQPADGR